MIRDQKLWTWHLAAGLLVLVLLGLHMAIMHLETLLGIRRAGSLSRPGGGFPAAVFGVKAANLRSQALHVLTRHTQQVMGQTGGRPVAHTRQAHQVLKQTFEGLGQHDGSASGLEAR